MTLLSPAQIAFRNAALVRNLRSTYPQASNYSDEVLIKAYNEWFLDSEADKNEAAFLDYIDQEPN